MDSKYAKYSTEQLEVILTHLTDPEEKELVRKELSSRYYQHYLNLSNGSQNELAGPGEIAAPEGPPEANPGLEEMPGDENEAEADLVDLGELEPIKLTSPVPPETTAPPAEKVAKKKQCFIATAAYGSDLAREVVLLQNYRDQHLSRTFIGRKVIEAYYRVSPYPAALVRRHELFKRFARYLLTPLILLIKKHPGNGADLRNS